MPIYEFYCPDCHTVFSFLSRRVAGRKRPACPRCGKPRLDRLVSGFAVSTGRAQAEGETGPAGPDETGMERAMAELAGEAEAMPEDDPRAAARLMRRFHESAGMPLGEGAREAIRRMEAGEDPEKIEEELGDRLEEDDVSPAARSARRQGRRRRRGAPAVDDNLYEL